MRAWLLAVALVGCRADKGAGEGDLDSGGVEGLDGDGDGYPEGEDCDDADPDVSPGVVEICDGVDNDCDGEADEDVTSTFYADDDGDGFGDGEAEAEACDAPPGHVAVGTDCDDGEKAVYPGAAEQCDGVDNDCDAAVDEDVVQTWYPDADSDGYGDGSDPYEVCDPPPGYIADAGDCDDTDDASFPGGEEVCDEADNDCDGDVDEGVQSTFYPDIDGDGFGDPAGAPAESCDTPTGYAANTDDCDDEAAAISPVAAEICNGIDDDCDGEEDEPSAADAATFYADTDGDGFGDAGDATDACDQPAGYVDDDTDCDDAAAGINPGTAEICDGADNDCDGETDEDSASDAAAWYADSDSDGYGSAVSQVACDQPAGFAAAAGDCDDGEPASNPGEAEACDELDNDCDGSTDEGVQTTFYADSDGDGHGDLADPVLACSVPAGAAANATDCDDGDAQVSPNAYEVCNGVDDDCDGTADQGALDESTFYADSDEDGYGDPGATASGCEQPSGYLAAAGDCDDGDAGVNPAGVEECDGADNDCDGTADDAAEVLGAAAACAARDCAEILDSGPDEGDGTYWIDPAETGAYQAYCLMDPTYAGGGWTLIAVTSDDGQHTWTWSNRAYWEGSTSTFGSLSTLNKDYRSAAFTGLAMSDALFLHAPSGKWAAYEGLGDGSKSLGAVIDGVAERVYYTTGSGYPMTAGTISTSGTRLCSTNLVFNACGQDTQGKCNADNDDTHGPTWNINNNHGCPYDDTNVYGGLGPDYVNQTTERNDGIGFGWAISGNTGSSGAGQNYMQIFVR